MVKHAFFYVFFIISISGLSQEQINQYNSEGQRDGLWRVNFEGTNQLKFEGNFKNGIETGKFKFYKKGFDKHPSAIMEFEGAGIAKATYYTQEGKPITQGMMVNKERNGEWIYFHKTSSDTMMVENYSHGKLEGLQITYFPNGETAEKTNYRNDLKNGESFVYSDSGQLLQHLNYKNGELHGPATYYNMDGEKLIEGNYKEDRKTGTWKYYENSKLKEEKQY